MLLNKNHGAILIISLWIAAILVVFSLSIAYRVNIGLRLTKLYRDKLKAHSILEGALARIIEEKRMDTNSSVDYFAESWSAKTKVNEETGQEEPYFKDAQLGDGNYTISYEYRQSIDDIEPTIFYGLQDEQSKFNINNVITDAGGVNDDYLEKFRALFDVLGKGALSTEQLTAWIGTNHRRFYCLEELQEGVFDKDVLYTYDKDKSGSISSDEVGILEYITIYGDGNININTAPVEIIKSVFQVSGYTGNVTDFIDSFVLYRNGNNNLPISSWTDFYNVLMGLGADFSGQETAYQSYYTSYFISSSDTYRANIDAKLRSVKKDLEVVLELKTGNQPKILYWYEN